MRLKKKKKTSYGVFWPIGVFSYGILNFPKIDFLTLKKLKFLKKSKYVFMCSVRRALCQNLSPLSIFLKKMTLEIRKIDFSTLKNWNFEKKNKNKFLGVPLEECWFKISVLSHRFQKMTLKRIAKFEFVHFSEGDISKKQFTF